MAATEFLAQLLGFDCQALSREERIIVEAKTLTRIYAAIEAVMEIHHSDYFRLLKLDGDEKLKHLEEYFLRYIVTDIVSTGDYTIAGIAMYAQTAEDIIYDVMTGKNCTAPFAIVRKIINLHQSVRPRLYQEFMLEIIAEYQKN